MVPLWSRARPISNVYLYLFIDVSFTLFWLIAWASVAAYVVAGKNAERVKGRGKSCDNFGFGAASKCRISEVTIILGVTEMLLFAATTYISIQKALHQEGGEMMSPQSRDNDSPPHTEMHPRQTSQTKAFGSEG